MSHVKNFLRSLNHHSPLRSLLALPDLEPPRLPLGLPLVRHPVQFVKRQAFGEKCQNRKHIQRVTKGDSFRLDLITFALFSLCSSEGLILGK